jgi:NAD(P)-dependent dehydrogenase (short-subunit alcohol dehydrogenase family)
VYTFYRIPGSYRKPITVLVEQCCLQQLINGAATTSPPHLVHFTATTVRVGVFVTGIKNAGAFYAAREVLPAMVEAGRGTILLTGASAALRGKARFSALAVGKFGLRALAQSIAREFGPQGIHVSHVIIDGQINTPSIREMMPDREEHTMLSPDAIAETYWQLHAQDRTAWTLEADLRPSVESF